MSSEMLRNTVTIEQQDETAAPPTCTRERPNTWAGQLTPNQRTPMIQALRTQNQHRARQMLQVQRCTGSANAGIGLHAPLAPRQRTCCQRFARMPHWQLSAMSAQVLKRSRHSAPCQQQKRRQHLYECRSHSCQYDRRHYSLAARNIRWMSVNHFV